MTHLGGMTHLNVQDTSVLHRLLVMFLGLIVVSSTSYVASGIAVKYVAAFRPESYQPFTDRIEIFSPDGSRSVLCVHARNELPRLKCENGFLILYSYVCKKFDF